MGYPTVNLKLHHETLPPTGVYAIEAVCGKNRYPGVLHLGPRPTFHRHELSAEAHLFEVHKSFYGKEIEIFFRKFIRNIRRFSGKNALKKQINSDVRTAKRMLKNPHKPALQKPASEV